jgi:hypothetical protein
LNKKQVIPKRGEHAIIFQDSRFQTISGNAIQCCIDMNNNFAIIVYFMVNGNRTGSANDRRVILGFPPWGLRTGG